jgi:hypothetical protein
MGNLYEYFRAPDDETALDCFDGGPDEQLFDSIFAKGVEPVVALGKVEALLLGVAYDQVPEDPRAGKLVSDPGAEATWIVTLTDRLRDALAESSTEQRASVAVPWSQIEEFGTGADPALVAGFLDEMAALARRAVAAGDHLYCWISL